MTRADVKAALEECGPLKDVLRRLGLTTEAAGHYQVHVYLGSGLGRRQHMYTGFASDVLVWLHAIAEGRVEVPAW